MIKSIKDIETDEEGPVRVQAVWKRVHLLS